MDETETALSKTVGAKIRPHYQRSLKRGLGPPEAYSLAYDEAVELVAKAQHSSVEKVRFASRDVLQAALDLATRQ